MQISNDSNPLSSFGVPPRTAAVPPRQIPRIFNGRKPDISPAVLKLISYDTLIT